MSFYFRFAALIRHGPLLVLNLALFGSSVTSQQLDAGTSNKTPPTTQATGDWSSYTVKGRDFSVLLPAAPAMSAYEVEENDPGTTVKLRNLVAVYSEGVVYAIYIYERSVGLNKIPKAFAIPEGVLSRDIKVGGIPGMEYGPENGNNRNQFFVNGRYIYQFATQSVPRANLVPGVARFFESIKFERVKTDREILEGPGEAPAQDSAKLETPTEDRILTGKEVTRKAIAVTKPEPTYTEMARKSSVTGTVVLRAVFSSSGAVTRIRAISGLPNGLTEKAIGAARQIKFIPAVKDGRFVSMHIQLEYSFNLY